MKYLLLTIVTLSVYGHEHLDCFLEANNHSILSVENDKVYLKKENISIEDSGFKIQDCFGAGFIVNNLFFDNQGIFTTLSSLSEEKAWNIVYCQNCEAWRSVDVRGNCTYCGKNPTNSQ